MGTNNLSDQTALNRLNEIHYYLAAKALAVSISTIRSNTFFSTCKFLIVLTLLLNTITETGFGQCQDVTQATWARNTTSSTNIYYDAAGGGITRLGNSTTHVRVTDATVINYDVAIYQTATIIPTASAQGTVNLPVGQSQTISVIYNAPQSIQTGAHWMIGWSSNTAFAGANSNGVR